MCGRCIHLLPRITQYNFDKLLLHIVTAARNSCNYTFYNYLDANIALRSSASFLATCLVSLLFKTVS